MRCTLCFFLVMIFSTSVFAQSSDIDAVEKELQAEKEAQEIYNRARKRAKIAVGNSSIGKQKKEAFEKYKNTVAERQECLKEWKKMSSSWKIGIIRTTKEMNQDFKKRMKAWDRCQPISQKSDKASDEWMALFKQNERIERKMTRKFLDDEIEKLKARKMIGLMRKLDKIMKRKKLDQPI